ncbi:MMPL family transporter [Chromobacterium haemolyticum]|uniref:MMPL family transporter n=1 Tax=Chromobacterium haemolyticum TaxID=394935 RepID=A0ABS3GSF3_9NEIS|nr:MMPL family transporter [Chromobacterium haemolyticum]MBK0416811.1 MMPL family transporter [Chromobacterium haemolyticum]MBO0417991.1 MMPL family transporter [Chromobacterium haemolyticum]MBO0501198.1 MMPL family transporter [Chromobacterium haemolyticum]
MRKRFYGWLALMLLCLASLLPYLGRPLPVQTNMLAMLPDDARQPEVERALAQLAAKAGERLVLMVGHSDPAQASLLAERMAVRLRAQPALRSVQGRIGDVDPARLLRPYAPYRHGLLTDADSAGLRQNPQAYLETLLLRRLSLPGQGAFGLPLAEDPFGLFGNVLAALPMAKSSLQIKDGWLAAERDGVSWRLLTAPLNGDAYDPALQQALSREVAELRALAEADGGKLAATGAVLFASEARGGAEAEMNMIGSVSMAAVIGLMLLVFRRLRHLALSGAVIAAGTLTAVAATLAVYGQLHLLTLVMGASLIGVAIDYSTHLFASQLQDGPDWDVERALAAIHPAIRMGLLTTLLGYGALALLPFPGLRQIAFFSTAGLVGAYLTVLWCVPCFVRQAAPASARGILPPIGRVFDRYCQFMRGRRLAALLLALSALSLPGLARLQADDDVHQLIRPSADLLAQEHLIRELAGQGNSRQFFLLEAPSEAALLRLGRQLDGRLDQLVSAGQLQGYQSLSSLLPPPERQQADHALLRDAMRRAGRQVLLDAGVRDEIADGYLAGLARPAPPLTTETLLAQPLAAPLRHLWLGPRDGVWRMAVMPGDFQKLDALRQAAQGLSGVTLVDKAASVSDLFRQFREASTLMFALSLLAIVALMQRRYGWRRALLLAAPVSLAVLFTLGALGWLGVSANLFVVLGFLMVLGVGVDYAIFVEEGRRHHQQAALLAVGLSALTTLLSFGLLAASATPAVSSFGLTQLIGVGLAVLLAPMVTLFKTGDAGRAEPC